MILHAATHSHWIVIDEGTYPHQLMHDVVWIDDVLKLMERYVRDPAKKLKTTGSSIDKEEVALLRVRFDVARQIAYVVIDVSPNALRDAQLRRAISK